MKKLFAAGLILILLLIAFPSAAGNARKCTGLSMGQKVYVPAYSHIYSGNREMHALLTVTLSVRNTDPHHAIEILSVDYYDTNGNLLINYLSSPILLNALGTARYIISQKDRSGGSGANFIVTWKSKKPVNTPIIETVMIGSRSSFTSRGKEILPSK